MRRRGRNVLYKVRRRENYAKIVIIAVLIGCLILLGWHTVVKSSNWFKSIIIENMDYNYGKDSNSIQPYAPKKTHPRGE
ncbi:hypothetical protein B0S90_0426 [Caldicellulosiruptor bescii]|uniref:Uncharacterized protein n=2 Tax=Caldicellulosiruptor bescii TaxID=31899 RepID=B9MM78_CALBD|nr:hypothetical protein [Caldicellulosiruptor bescii]ACM59310.1 hypothetical protein Athe_0158 [Caldicellulosiruptor bescii DSM 6725]PBC88234.1 hypothetical protein B0S87_1199 [Caldicellulosiruptor bescii]PBC92285.1 hypothetical protein B0S89_2794 [Caldicellulosiruptor bescii]PBD04904.1 hypothetical protein B0S85_2614 [Caldicellulosiruptor bescii]PBD05466.1 hypothetical protein B0S90_0426 [Caldicellulosiruptor bescii]